MTERFEIKFKKKNRLERLEEDMTASNLSEIMKEETTNLAGQTKKEPPALPTEDQEIKQLEDRRKEFRK